MTLAQEKAFKPGTPFKRKWAYEIPTRNFARAEKALIRLRENYDRMSPKEKKEIEELMAMAWRTLLTTAKDKRRFNAKERTEFWKIAMLYASFGKVKRAPVSDMGGTFLFDDVDD